MAGSNKRILLTGASGYVGQWVFKALVDKGYHVHELKADLTDIQALQRELSKAMFHVVIHLAGSHSTDAAELERVNVLGTKNLLNTLRLGSVEQFIFVSSIHVYGSVEGTIEDTSATEPKTAYGRSKLAVEQLLSKEFDNTATGLTVFRASNVYGAPYSMEISKWGLLFNDLCRQAFQNNSLVVNSAPNKLIDMVWLGHVTGVLLSTVAGNVTNGLYNLCSGDTVKLAHVAEQVQQAWKSYSGNIAAISYLQSADNDTVQYSYSVGKLNKFVSVSRSDAFIQEAIAIFKLLDKYKQNTDS